MAELEDVVNAINSTNSKLDEIILMLQGQALHNENTELFYLDVASEFLLINEKLEAQALHNENTELFYIDVNGEFLLINEKLDLINNSQGGYLKEEVVLNNEWFYERVSNINDKMSYNFVFLGVLTGIVFAFMIISIFFKRLT